MPLTQSQLNRVRAARLAKRPVRRRQVRRSNEVVTRLAAAIEIAEVTNAEVARATGFGQQYVSDVARGRYQDISLANARKFADYFGCAIEDLFPGRDEAVAS